MYKLTISGEIGWDVLPRDVQRQLDEAAGKDLDVNIASPGGYVSDGIEIYNAFRDYKRKYPDSQMMATIKGVAASMATYLAVNPAFDLIAAEDNAVFMIHNVWGGTVGDYREMLKTAEVFQGLTGIIADAYVNKTGISKDEIKNMMDEESWFFGSEILTAGFVDEIINTDFEGDKSQQVAHAKMKFKNLSEKLKNENSHTDKIAAMINSEVFKNTADEIKKDLKYDESKITAGIEKAQNPATNAGKNNTEEKTMTLEQLMAANPAAKIELDNMLDRHGKEKFEAGKQSVLTVAKEAAKIANSDSYHEKIRNYAVGVMAGENSMDALTALVVHADMTSESTASNAAKDETIAAGETSPEQQPQASSDGVIRNSVDFMAEIERGKNKNGVEVV